MIPRRLFFVSTFFVVLASLLVAQKLHTETQIKTEGSLTTATFKTSAGDVRIYLPGDMIAGDTLSGTVLAEPSGNNEKEKQKNVGILNGLVIQFGSQRWPVAGGVVQTLAIAPPPIQKPQLILLDEKGKRIGTATLPLLPLETGTLLLLPPPKTDTTQNFEFPPLGQSGHPLRIAGPFDGDSTNTNIQIGGSPAKIIAESPRGVVVQIPSGTTGQNNISASDNGHSATGRFRALKIELTAPKTSLLKGESTELHVSVNGLEGLSQPTQIQLQNQTPSNINLSGGNTQNIIIQPSQVTTGGTFNWSGTVTGTGTGGFNITGTIPSGVTTTPSPSPVTSNPTATPTPTPVPSLPPPSGAAVSPAPSPSPVSSPRTSPQVFPTPAPMGSPEATFTKADTDCCKKFLNADNAFEVSDDKGNGFKIFRNKLTMKIDGKEYEWEFTQDGKPFYIEWMFCHLNDHQIISQLSQVMVQRVKGGKTSESGATTSVSLHGPYRDEKSRRPTYGFEFDAQKIGTDTKEYGVSFGMDAETCAWSCQLMAEGKVAEFRTDPARSPNAIFNGLHNSDGLPTGATAYQQQAWWNAMYSYFFEIEDWLLWLNGVKSGDLDDSIKNYNVWRAKLNAALAQMLTTATPVDRSLIIQMQDLLKNENPSAKQLIEIGQKFDELHLRYGTNVPPDVRKQILREP